jgi:hypothetical protein
LLGGWFGWLNLHQISMRTPRLLAEPAAAGQMASGSGSEVGRKREWRDVPLRSAESASHQSMVGATPKDASPSMGAMFLKEASGGFAALGVLESSHGMR